MNADAALGLAQEVLWLAFKLAAPPLLAGLVVGVVVSVIQTATTVQDQTLSLVPKMAATLVALFLCFHWMLDELTAFIHRVLGLIGAG
jgi:flagellar biosynthetic protein FliQ